LKAEAKKKKRNQSTYRKIIIIQSGPENPSGNLDLLNSKSGFSADTDLFVFFQSVGYGSQNQFFDAEQWGK